MKDKLLNSVKASWPYLLTLIIGLYLAEILAGSVMALSRYKLAFADHMPTVLKQLALHPWHYYNLYLGQKNPVLIIVSVAVVLYTIYFALKRNSKHKAWETADTETHGSATWGNLKELSDHYFSINAKDLTTAFNKSTKAEILKSLVDEKSHQRGQINMNGTILGIVDKRIVYQNNSTKPNRNIFVVGGPGSYKTQSVVITNLFNETENSIVVTDPKGELYEKTAGIKLAQGYQVHVVNFANMAHSDRYNPFDYIQRDIQAETVATKIVQSENAEGKKDVWFSTQRQLLKALILFVMNHRSPEQRNLAGVTQVLQENDVEAEEKGADSPLDTLFLDLTMSDPARRAYELGFKKAKGEMKASIIESLLATISKFVDKEVADFTSFSDFDLKEIGNAKVVLYVIIPVMDNTYESFINLFFSQLFDELYKLAADHHAKLPHQVDFILDEFVNLGKFPKYEEFLATCRGTALASPPFARP